MTDKEAAANVLNEKISQLQKTLTASEHDRRILQVSYRFFYELTSLVFALLM